MSHRSHSVHAPSESECESESESESGSGSGSGSEEEQEQLSIQWSDARELKQCGSAVGGASCGPQTAALEDYFAHLTKQYNSASSMEGCTDSMRSYQKPKQRVEEKGCTCTNHKSHSNTNNRYIGYAHKNNNGCTCLAKEDRMVSVSSKSTTSKKGKEEHGYDYYGSNLVNNERVGHVGKNNNDSRYISQEYSTIPQISRFKGKIESVNAYEKNKFDSNRHGANYLGTGYCIPPSTSKPRLKKEAIESGCAYYDDNHFDNNQHVKYGANYLGAGYSIPFSTCKPKPRKEKIESGCVYAESDFDTNQHAKYGLKKNYHMTYNGSKESSTNTSVKSNKRITYM